MNRTSIWVVCIFVLPFSLLPFTLLATGPGNNPGNDPKDNPDTTESATTVQAPAPVMLSAVGDAVTVRWQTTPNEDNTLYSVQRSADGENWMPVFSLRCNNHSANGRKHAIYDRNLEPGNYVYRVRSVSENGVIAFTPTAEITVGSVFANPTPAMAPADGEAFGAR